MARVDVSMSREEVASYLPSQRSGTLASVGPDGFPHQVAMWFVPEPDQILMWTFRRSQKAVNLRRNPRASLLVEDGDTYDTLRGVMVQGEVELIDALERVLAVGRSLHARYGAAYEAVIARQAPKRVAIVLPMTHVVSWDFRKLASSGSQ